MTRLSAERFNMQQRIKEGRRVQERAQKPYGTAAYWSEHPHRFVETANPVFAGHCSWCALKESATCHSLPKGQQAYPKSGTYATGEPVDNNATTAIQHDPEFCAQCAEDAHR